MAQHDYIIANQSGAAFRSDLNNGLAAIVSQNSGAAQPSTTYAYQWWADTTTGLLKLRNAANNAWITIGTLADANLGLLSLAGGTLTGALLVDDSGTAALPAIAFDGDPNTGIFSPGADQLGIATNGVERVEFGTTEVVFNDGGADVDFRVEGDTKANLFKVDAGTDAVSIDGNFSVTGSFDTASLNGGPLAGFRNRIINGDMRIDQRYSGSALTPVTSPSGSYVVDRWYVTQELGNSWTLQQNRNSVTPPTGFTNYFGIQVNSASTPATGSYNALAHAIEGFNISSLGWGSASAQSVTLSFWVRSSVTGQHGGSVRNGAATFVSYPFSYTISAANTWEYKTVTIPGPTTGTFATDNSTGINIFFDLGCGSTSRGTAGSWATQNALGATGDVNVISTASATFFLTGVQLEPGPVATPFERRPIGTELSLCQRYYATTRSTVRVYNAAASVIAHANHSYFPATMRTAPSVTMTSTVSERLNVDAAYPQATNISVDGFTATIVTTGGTQQAYDNNRLWTASAEL